MNDFPPQRLNPAVLGVEQIEVMQKLDLEQLSEHPLAFYRAGMDALGAAGLIEPQQDMVLLRGLTIHEIYSRPGQTIHLPSGDRMASVVAFEIVKIGPVVRQVQQLDPGMSRELTVRQDSGVGMVRITYPHGSLDDVHPGWHCLAVASAADALDVTGDGVYQLARACFIAGAWDPRGAAQKVAGVVQQVRDDAHRLAEEAQAEAARAIQERERARLRALGVEGDGATE